MPAGFTKSTTLREKCPNTEFFWSAFSRIWTEKGWKIRTRKIPYLDNFYAGLGLLGLQAACSNPTGRSAELRDLELSDSKSLLIF